MDRSLLGLLDRAFELANFLHRDRELALEITIDALGRVAVLAEAQEKRRYYRPAGRRLPGIGGLRKRRSRVFMTRAQLLQRLVYGASEPHERRQEAAGKNVDEDQMTLRYIAYLVRICLKRNAFHVAVGLGRLLYAYPTDAALALYDLTVQDPDHLRDPDYFRARKKRLLDELRQRFGPRLRTRRIQRGEQRFETRKTDDGLLRLVSRCLELMTPWETSCTVPERLEIDSEALEALRFRGAHPDDEHPVEMNRIHAFLHPACFRRLTRALGLDPPEKRLEIPALCLAQASGPDEPRNSRRPPEELGETGKIAILDELRRREDARRRAVFETLCVLLDGEKIADWNMAERRSVRVVIGDGAELLEVVARDGGEDMLLAAHLLPDPEVAARRPRPQRARVRLAGGRGFDFLVSPLPGRDPAGLTVKIQLRRSPFAQAAARFARRRSSEGRTAGRPLRWRALPALAIAVLAILGASLFLSDRDRPPELPRTRGGAVAAMGIAEIERIFVDHLGSEPFAESLRADLRDRLAEGNRFAPRGEADAVVLRDPGRVPPEITDRIALRLVNERGEVLWRGVSRGPSREAAARIAAEIDAAIRRGGSLIP